MPIVNGRASADVALSVRRLGPPLGSGGPRILGLRRAAANPELLTEVIASCQSRIEPIGPICFADKNLRNSFSVIVLYLRAY